MRGGFFWRIFGAILASLLITVLLFTGILATSQQQTRQAAYENEVRLQAREIAEYMANLNQLSSVRDNATMKFIISRKIEDIHNAYNADIWIVSYNSGLVQMLDSSWNTSESIASDSVTEQLLRIQKGEEIRATNLFPELGAHMVTIGVPWRYTSGAVVGGVLLHISTDQLRVSPAELLPQILLAALTSLSLGALVSIFIASSQIKPLKELDSAVREFTKGDLSRRVELHCGGELEALGNSINRMASELSQLETSRRSFVAEVSHELRSPLTCIRGYVEAILDGTIAPEDQPQYLNVVLSETNRLTDLVRDLLDMSRIESGKFPMQIEPFDFGELIRRVLINFEPRIDEKRIQVALDLLPDPCFVRGDANRISQVITNLVDNAIKFLPEGGTLALKTERVGRDVRLSVKNNGPMIAPEDLPHLFERFYKADKAHTSGGGTGLGLSICQLIVREHHSEITVESTEKETCFAFCLRACDPPARENVLPGA